MALLPLPPRFIGYGAYNLANDRELGRYGADPRDYFQYLHDGGWPINLVRVLVFRNATIELLPTSRAIRLYTAEHTVNPNYLANLETLVDRAAATGFWVQVCLFNYHAIVDPNETPENIPPELQPLGPSTCERLKKFFNPSDATVLNKQREVITAVGTRLKNKGNVLWELGNELRMDGGCGDAENRDLARWMQVTEKALIETVGGTPLITTSTGITNESIILGNVPLSFFDFHAGQWGVSAERQDFDDNIPDAKRRAQSFNPNAMLFINDDGLHRTNTAARITDWANKAFSLKLHYVTKSPYPPGAPFSIAVLDALKAANRGWPP